MTDWRNVNYEKVARFLERLHKDDFDLGYHIRNGRQIFPDVEDEIHGRRLHQDLSVISESVTHGSFPETKLTPPAFEYFKKMGLEYSV